MGYTHYFRGAPVITEDAIEDIRKIIEASGVSIVGGYGDAGTEPILTAGKIVLNGEEEDSHETLFLTDSDTGFNFTKTARKPYDAVVGAALLRVLEDSPNFEVSSDGYWDEWLPARELYTSVTGREASQPWTDD